MRSRTLVVMATACVLLIFNLAFPVQAADFLTGVVTRVVDGDTIVVRVSGRNEKVRLIGVDTPETVDPRKPVQYFGKEASAFTKRTATGKTVRLEFDQASAATGYRDKYQRLLAYVFLPDGTLLNAEIIRQGFGHAYTRFPFARMDEFRALEKEAREAGRGLWAAGGSPAEPSRPAANGPPSGGCRIKGNITAKGERIYHLSGMRFYDKCRIDESRGERWFCSEEEAIKAGWRKSRQ